jgi:circadian clock protein KaiC
MEKTKTPIFERLSTGIEGLDLILKGGLTQNRLYLVAGHPGTGKTTIGLQFLLEGQKRGEKGLYITVTESREELIAAGKSHGWDLENLEIKDLTVMPGGLSEDSHYTIFHPVEVELDETTKEIVKEVERINPSRVVFDSLADLRMLTNDSLRFRRQIFALKQFFNKCNCTVMLLDDYADGAYKQLDSVAHGVINLEYAPAEYGKQRHHLRVVKMRGVNFQSGSHDFNIETGGIVVFPRLSAIEKENGFKSGVLSSTSPELESLLGGLDYGTSTIITGPAGVGKSTFSLMYAYNAAERGERSAIYVFDENLETIHKRMSSLGLDLQKHVESGLIELRQIKLAELTPGELSFLISREVEHNQTRLIVVDSVNGYLMTTPQERYLMRQFNELLGYLNRQGVVSILVVGQHGLIGAMQTPIDMSYMADTVILLRYFEADGAVRQAMSVMKKRTGRHERTIREFRIGEGGIILGNPLIDFRGVLTGVPSYQGNLQDLMKKSDGDDKGEN